MSDSKDKPIERRRGRSAKKQSEEPDSSNMPMDIDPTDSAAKDASKSKLEESSAPQPSGSYGGARPKVKSQKPKKESKPESIKRTIQRAVLILESTACRRRDAFRENQRVKKMVHNVTRYLGPGWVDTLIQDVPEPPPEGSKIYELREYAKEILISEFERRRSEGREDFKPWIPVQYRLAVPPIPFPLSREPVECEFDEDFEIEIEDLDLPLQVKLPDPSMRSPESPRGPRGGGGDDEPPPDAPPGGERAEGGFAIGYRGRNIPSYLFVPYFQFARPEQGGPTSQEACEGLDEIYERYGANTWRMYASNAYQTGRYHTEEELRIAREKMSDRNISDENYRDWYHAARRGPLDLDEDTTIEIPELESRLISFLITMEKITTAMLYIDIFRDLERREEEGRRVEEARREARARMVTDSDHSSDSYQTALVSDIVEDYVQERTRIVYERLVGTEEAGDPGVTSEKYPSALASGSSTSSPLEVQSPDVISPGDVSKQESRTSTKSSMRPPSVDSRSDPTSEKGLLRSFETTSSSKESSSFKTGSSSGEKSRPLKSRVASLEKSESFESTSRSISPLPLDTEMSEEEASAQADFRVSAQANLMGHIAVAGLLQSIEASILQEEESEMEVQPEPSEEGKSEDSKELDKEKEELAKRKERRSKDPGETDSKRPHMG